MKTQNKIANTLSILFSILFFTVSASQAEPGKAVRTSGSASSESSSNITFTTPREADFNNSELVTFLETEALKPVTPANASFDENVKLETSETPADCDDMTDLRPDVPQTAEFNDHFDSITYLLDTLAPVPPMNAGFEDSL
jgi:hypothetical protein